MKRRTVVLSLLSFAPAAALFAQKKVSDDQIHDQVMRKLANDPVVKGGGFKIDVKDGAVTIRGAVEKEKQKERAEKLTRKIAGVKHVNNELQVVQRQPR